MKQYEKHVKVYSKKQKQDLQNIDYLNYILGKYICFAFNDPKHYPSKAILQTNSDDSMTDEEMERQGRYNTIRMGGVIK